MLPACCGALLASALAITAIPVTAQAQQQAPQQAAQQQNQPLEEITVTGTRIVSKDYVSNSPIVTVNAADFQSQTGLNVESYLNKLPQYNPSFSPVTTGFDVQITPVNSVGIAAISLRGFGPNRSLVLVDGKRTVPVNSLMVTDVNQIPSALIQRVETITGGASAVYGADAVGGVTNFILKDNFQGLDVNMQSGQTSAGDGAQSEVSVLVGANFDNGKGNVTAAVESYKSEAAYQINHDIYRKYWANPATGGSFFFLQGINGYTCYTAPFFGPFGNCPNIGTANALLPDKANTGLPLTNGFYGFSFGGDQFSFNPDGTIFKADGAHGLAYFTTPIDGETFAHANSLDTTIFGAPPTPYTGVKWNNIQAYIAAPQTRNSFFGSGHYDLNDHLRVYARATFAQSKTKTILFGTDAISGWEGTVPYNPTTDSPIDPTLNITNPAGAGYVNPRTIADNPAAYANPSFIATGMPGAQHPVPVQLAILLNSRPAPGAIWQPQWYPTTSLPPRSTFNTNSVWQLETGLNLKVGEYWTGEVYISRGRTTTYNIAAGNLSLQRYRALIAAPDYGRGAMIQGNATSIRPNFGAAAITCTSGFYNTFFAGDQPLSQDCFNAVNATLQTRAENDQAITEINFSGPVAKLPGGEVQAAVGYQGRRNSSEFNPDILQSTVSFTDQVIGVYPTGYMNASTTAKDVYFEGLIPLISGKKAAQKLELEVGARHSNYEWTDSETTWKSLINYQATQRLRFRGGFNRATRSPNLGELFLSPQEIFTGGGNFGDPCELRSNAPYGAGGAAQDPALDPTKPFYNGSLPPTQIAPGQTAAGAASAMMICQAMMGGPGSQAATTFYQDHAAGGQNGSFFAWVDQVGNPNLQSETADTWTFGLVGNSPFKSRWLSNATLTVDWYRYNIKNAIMLYSLDYANYLCFGTNIVTTPQQAAAQAASRACQLLPRDQISGVPLTTTISYDNQATINTSGVDVSLNWSLPFEGGGTFGVNLQGTWLDYYRTKQSPAVFDVQTDWKGSLGPTLTGTNPGAYSYRLNTDFSYSKNKWHIGLRWHHLPSVWTSGYASQQAIKENNAAVTAGASGILLGYTPTTELKTKAYNSFDLSFTMNVNDKIQVRGGVTNLLDTEPNFVGPTAGYSPADYPTRTDLNAVCGSAPGCQNPTSWSLPSPGSYSQPGYYDNLGRSYFVGINARF